MSIEYKKVVSAKSKLDINEGDEVVFQDFPNDETGKPEERAVLLSDYTDEAQNEFRKAGAVKVYEYKGKEENVKELSEDELQSVLDKEGIITTERLNYVEIFRDFLGKLFDKGLFADKKRIETTNYRDVISVTDLQILIRELNVHGD